MTDEQTQHQTDAPTTPERDQAVFFERPLDREALLSSLHKSSNASPRPVTPGRGQSPALDANADRQAMPDRELENIDAVSKPLSKPDERPRPTMADPGEVKRPDVPERDKPLLAEEADPKSTVKNDSCEAEVNKTRPGMADGSEASVKTSAKKEQSLNKEEKDVPPDSADLVTVEEAVKIFSEAGLPRHIRTIQKYCSRKTGRALVSYQIPTENGIRYMIERSSIRRFIEDATHQAPTGRLEDDVAISPSDSREETAARNTNSVAADLAVYDHPYVKRLESEVEKEKERYASLQMRYEKAMDLSNQRLVELQQASAVAQSESLGRFLIESKRMEIDPEQSPAPVHKPSAQGESMVQ